MQLTIELLNKICETNKVEQHCEDNSCNTCITRYLVSRSNLASLLINNALDRLFKEEFIDPQIIGEYFLDELSLGILIGLQIAEIRELEKLT